MGSVGAVGAAFLLGNGYGSRAFADQLASTGTIADGFVVNGRHLSFGVDPQREMWVAGQLFNLNHYNAVPSRFKVSVEYGTDHTYGFRMPAELRELVTHVPVWNGVPTGPVKASLTDVLRANQFYVHAEIRNLRPGETYHYRFVYTAGKQTGYTPNATFTTAPDASAREPFTFTAYGDQGITGAPGTGNTIDNAVSLQPESDSHITDDYYDPTDPDYYDPASKKAPSDIDPVAALVRQITKVRNPHNHTPTRFNLLAGDICYANPSGNAVAIINPDGKGGTQPEATNTPAPPAHSGGWDDFDPYVWTSYFSTIEPSSASTPWMFATGNHDVELFHSDLDADATTIKNYGSLGYGGHAKRLDLPDNGPSKCPSVYSFTYSNVAVISVDANDLSYEVQGNLGYSDGSQAAWVKKRLAGFRADKNIDFIIVFFHHCAFSTCEATPRTVACAPPSRRCSPSTRWTWRSRATTTSTSGPTRSTTTRPPTAGRRPSKRSPSPPRTPPWSIRPRTAPPTWSSARPGGPATPGPAALRATATSSPASTPASPATASTSPPTRRRRSARTSARRTSPTPTSRSTGPRPGSGTTPSSPSTSSQPGPGRPRR